MSERDVARRRARRGVAAVGAVLVTGLVTASAFAGGPTGVARAGSATTVAPTTAPSTTTATTVPTTTAPTTTTEATTTSTSAPSTTAPTTLAPTTTPDTTIEPTTTVAGSTTIPAGTTTTTTLAPPTGPGAVPTAAPGVIPSVSATPGNARAVVSWGTPPDNGSPITRYAVHRTTNPSGAWTIVNSSISPTLRSLTVTGLTNGTRYYFRVFAVNADGTSGSSAVVSAVPAAAPAAPGGVRAVPCSARSVVTWTAPNGNGSAIARYAVHRTTNPSGAWTIVNSSISPTLRSLTVTGLTNGTRYYFRVIAVNAVGAGPASALVSAIPSATTPASAPQAVTATPASRAATLRWDPSGCAAVSRVELQRSLDNRVWTTVNANIAGSARSYTVSALASGTRYYFRLRSIVSGGTSPYSTTVSALVPTAGGWLEAVNSYRSMSGVPAVVADAALSAGDALHSCYMLYNGMTHDEVPGQPGYSAAGDAAGNRSNVALNSSTTTPIGFIDQWMAAPLHAIGILRPHLTRIGYGECRDGAAPVWRGAAASLDVISGLQFGSSSSPVLFPGNGARVRVNSFDGESPDPTAFCPGGGGYRGLPIIAMLPASPGSVTATLTGPSGGLSVCVLTAANTSGLTSSLLAGSNAVLVIPRLQLADGAYRVSLRSAGGPLSWSFTVDAV